MIPHRRLRLLNAAFLGDAPKHYGGDIRIAKDGLLVSLPAEAEAVTYEDLFLKDKENVARVTGARTRDPPA